MIFQGIKRTEIKISFFVWMATYSIVAERLSNVALDKPTTQFPRQFSHFSSGLAVDGNTNQDFHGGGSCTHTLPTDAEKPYWEVDLGADYYIEFIKIYNRRDCCADRLQQVLITTSKDGVTYKTFTYHHGQVGSVEDLYPALPWIVGRWVKISLSIVEALTLCEVEVMARTSIPKVRFQTISSARASGSILQSLKTIEIFKCLSLCHKYEDCYSIEIERDPAMKPAMMCTLFDSIEYTSDVNEYVQFIRVTV